MDQRPAEDPAALRALHAFELARHLPQVAGIRSDQSAAASVRVGIEVGHEIVAFHDRREVLVPDPVVERQLGRGLVGVLQVEHHPVGIRMGYQRRGGLDPADITQQQVGEPVANIAIRNDVAAVGRLHVQVVVHGPLVLEAELERMVSSDHAEVVQQLEDLGSLELRPPLRGSEERVAGHADRRNAVGERAGEGVQAELRPGVAFRRDGVGRRIDPVESEPEAVEHGWAEDAVPCQRHQLAADIAVGREPASGERVRERALLDDGVGLQEAVGPIEGVLVRQAMVDPDVE